MVDAGLQDHSVRTVIPQLTDLGSPRPGTLNVKYTEMSSILSSMLRTNRPHNWVFLQQARLPTSEHERFVFKNSFSGELCMPQNLKPENELSFIHHPLTRVGPEHLPTMGAFILGLYLVVVSVFS